MKIQHRVLNGDQLENMIDLILVKNKTEGNLKAHKILKDTVDVRTLLALSGGTAPNYKKMIVEPDDFIPGAIAVVDERYGEQFHKNSNELLLKKAGVKEFADSHCIETHKIITGNSFLDTEKIYEKTVGELFEKFKKRVAVMGIGANLHTAGIFPHSAALKSPDYVVAQVVDDKFPKRISLTLKALGEFDSFVVLMFGKEKRKALEILLDEKEHDMQKYPAIFYRKTHAKVSLITDIA